MTVAAKKRPRRPRPLEVEDELLARVKKRIVEDVQPRAQFVRRVRCPWCDTSRVIQISAKAGTVYYRCNGDPLCVDRETMRAARFKVYRED